MHSNNITRKLKQEINNKKEIIKCANQFGLMGDPTRMKICWLLCKHPELSVSEIAEVMNVSISTISHSLKKLKNYSLVESRRNHKQIFYRLADSDFNTVIKNNLQNI